MKDKKNKAARELAKALWSMNSAAETAVKEALKDSISPSARAAFDLPPKAESSSQMETAINHIENRYGLSWDALTPRSPSDSAQTPLNSVQTIETHEIEANWYEKEPCADLIPAIETLAAEQNERYNIPDTGKQDIETAAIYDDWYKETTKPLVEWPDDDSPEPIQAVQPTSAQLPPNNLSVTMAAA